MVTHLASAFTALQQPSFGQLWQLRSWRLEVNQASRPNPAAGCEQRAATPQQPTAVGWIQKYDIEWSRLSLEVRHAISHDDVGSARAQHGHVGPQNADHCWIMLNQHRAGGPTRQGLQSERAASGKQIQTIRAHDPGLQPVKQGFADPIRSRTQLRARRDLEPAAAPLSANDPELPQSTRAPAGISHGHRPHLCPRSGRCGCRNTAGYRDDMGFLYPKGVRMIG